MWLFVEPELALLVSWDGVGVAKTGIGVSKPGIGFSKPGIEVLKAGIVIYSFLPREVRRARHPLCMFRPVSPRFPSIIPACSQQNARSYIRKTSPAKMFQPFSLLFFCVDYQGKSG